MAEKNTAPLLDKEKSLQIAISQIEKEYGKAWAESKDELRTDLVDMILLAEEDKRMDHQTIPED